MSPEMKEKLRREYYSLGGSPNKVSRYLSLRECMGSVMYAPCLCLKDEVGRAHWDSVRYAIIQNVGESFV